MNKNSNGFAVVEVLITAVVTALIAGAVFYVYQSNKDGDEPENSSLTASQETEEVEEKPADNSKPATSAPKTNKISVTPYGGSKLGITAPSGWKLVKGDASKIEKTISGYIYQLSFQINSEDYLKLPAYKSTAVLGQASDSGGDTVYLVKVSGNIALSSCRPVGGKGCSLTQNGKHLFVLASTSGGSGGPGLINFSHSSTKTLIKDIKSIISSSNL